MCSLTLGAFAIRRCTSSDAPTLAALGAKLFAETYGPTHPEAELSRYLARAFSVAGVHETISEDGVSMFLAEDSRDVVWLQVWKEAPWAVGFYQRMGFSVVGSAPFYFGDQVSDDHIMARTL